MSEMSPGEKLALLETLWDDLASNPADVPVHEWQKVEMARRKESLKSNPASGLSWEDVEQHFRERHGR